MLPKLWGAYSALHTHSWWEGGSPRTPDTALGPVRLAFFGLKRILQISCVKARL